MSLPTFGAPTALAATPDFTGDPDLDPGLNPAPEETSDLEDLREELRSAVVSTIVLAVQGRPKYAVEYRLDFTGKQVDHWRRLSKNKHYVDGMDGIKFASLVLASNCTAIHRDGAPLIVGGEVQTFTSKAFQEVLGVDRAVEAVRALYGLDGHVAGAGTKVMSEAGYGDEAEVADPTL